MTFEELKNLVDTKKAESIQAQARIDAILDSLETEYGTRDVEQLKVKLSEIKADLNTARTQYATLLKEAENLVKELQ